MVAGEDIFGPFEAGFSSMQDGILSGLGCTGQADGERTGTGYIIGGVDTQLADDVLKWDCSLDSTDLLLDGCGGHTKDYHFHQRLSCLYEESGSHSTKVGEMLDGQFLYGKWEDYSNQVLPQLDACGGHYGDTPDGENYYHYHVQDTAPFTTGCFGPNEDGSLVSVEQCRALYNGCGDGDNVVFQTDYGAVDYDPWCPCFDASGSNVVSTSGARLGTDDSEDVEAAANPSDKDVLAYQIEHLGCTNSYGEPCVPGRRLLFGTADDCTC